MLYLCSYIMEHFIHNWSFYQCENKHKIIKTDTIALEDVTYVGGLDISFDKKNPNNACAYLTIYDIKCKSIVYEDYIICQMTVPYISGYLGFREIPHYKKLLDKIVDTDYYPQIILIDGCGILHQREFGCASQLGLELNIPTIGVAKTLLSHDGLQERQIKNEFMNKCSKKGDNIPLIGKSGTIWGSALKSCNETKTPIYVTIGHKIGLNTAIKIVLQACIYKIPEPIRNSDIKSKLHIE
jgi:deoxyinosine 3'endonuclease (endonuclease V)